MNFNLTQRTILLTVAGSRAYGLHTEESDIDVKGVCVAPREVYFGFLNNFEQADKSSQIADFRVYMREAELPIIDRTKLEGSVYEIRKFMGLAVDCNPNILDVLFCRDAEVRKLTPVGQMLRDRRDIFISAKAKHTFSGYAIAQLKRIKGHYRWHTAGPKAKPTRGDYDLPEQTLIPKDQLAAANAAIQKQIDEWNIDYGDLDDAGKIHIQEQVADYLRDLKIGSEEKWWAAARHVGLDDNFIELMQRERQYASAMNEWKRYQRWLKQRNPARAALEAAHGYDTKHGAHLVRLLRMGKEIMETGKVNVWRGDIDGDELKAIRAGAWSYNKLVDYAESMDGELQRMYKEKEYVVPHVPDKKLVDDLCIEVVEKYLNSPR